MKRTIFACLFFFAIQPAPQAASQQKVEKQFQSWLQADLWPEAKGLGVKKRVFKKAFAGVALNWKLPDLVPPGSKPPKKTRTKSGGVSRPVGLFFPNPTFNPKHEPASL